MGWRELFSLGCGDLTGGATRCEAICRAVGLSVWVLTVSEKGVPGLFRMGEEGWILAFMTQWPGHYDAFTVPEALQQAAKDGQLCLREGRLVAAEADGAARGSRRQCNGWREGGHPRTYSTAAACGGRAAERSRGCGGGGGRGGR